MICLLERKLTRVRVTHKVFSNVLRYQYRTFSASVCIRAPMEMVWHCALPTFETSFIGYQTEQQYVFLLQ